MIMYSYTAASWKTSRDMDRTAVGLRTAAGWLPQSAGKFLCLLAHKLRRRTGRGPGFAGSPRLQVGYSGCNGHQGL
jgi:hypothetical protein